MQRPSEFIRVVASRRVASMRCSATAFKKGKQKLRHTGHISPSFFSPEECSVLAYARCGSRENYTRRNAHCRVRFRTSEPRSVPRSKTTTALPVRRLYATRTLKLEQWKVTRPCHCAHRGSDKCKERRCASTITSEKRGNYIRFDDTP